MNARDDRLDSAKGILITLVVLGHWLETTNYWDDGLLRALRLLVAVIMTWAIIASAVVVRNVFVKAGKRSLAIYLLHGFFIFPATPWLGVAFDRYGPIAASLICMAATLLVVHILSYQCLIEVCGHWAARVPACY